MARIVVFSAELTVIAATTRATGGIRWGGPADRDALVAAGAGPAMVDSAFRESAIARVAVAEEDGRVIGQNVYLAAGALRVYPWLTVELAQGREVLAMGGLVVPEHRGRHLLADIKGFAARAFLDQGYVRMVSVVETRNTASLRAHARIGAVALATLTRIRLGRLDLVRDDRSTRHLQIATRPYVFSTRLP
ncbi:GNAT family N-acetyltransferase [Aquibium microcysteis]|uniref:GNAT family N-acetyltransferase n=1 Tax=Aquibium microcysteis TaxID=675281 RepID=UPI00165D2BD1|nr:hypothetical protein [Aquibium microcysteis]